jgi:hypothetical protein
MVASMSVSVLILRDFQKRTERTSIIFEEKLMPDLSTLSDRQLLELLKSFTEDGVLLQTEQAQAAQNELMTRPNCFRIRPDYFDEDFDKALAYMDRKSVNPSVSR